MEDIRVIVWGVGAMGGGMAKLITEKKGIRLVGAIDKNIELEGKDIGEVLNLDENIGVLVSCDPEKVIRETDADIVLLATNSFIKNVFPQIKLIVEKGMDCVTIAEEMANPYRADKDLAKQINDLAVLNNATVLGTGVNPGFVLDTLIITLTASCRRVDKIKAARINDLSPFGKTVMETQGVGTTIEEFKKGVLDGTIVGHIGFRESIYMIADAIGIEIDEVVETREPIISNTYRETNCVKVEPGMVAGCKHIGYGMKGKEVIITLEHPQQIRPELEDIKTGDYIWIEGDPNLNLCIKPETPGGIGTIAMAVNMIPLCLNAKPGIVTMKDLPIPRASMGNMKEMI